MAKKRMFSLDIVDSDAFLELSKGAQLLYFHMSMRADDDGFVDKLQTLMKILGCKSKDIDELIASGFIIPFKDNVYCVKHWKINNLIRLDRYQPTKYQSDINTLYIKENGSYTLDENQGKPIAKDIKLFSIDENGEISKTLINDCKEKLKKC